MNRRPFLRSLLLGALALPAVLSLKTDDQRLAADLEMGNLTGKSYKGLTKPVTLTRAHQKVSHCSFEFAPGYEGYLCYWENQSASIEYCEFAYT